jgi:hypothetical protein
LRKKTLAVCPEGKARTRAMWQWQTARFGEKKKKKKRHQVDGSKGRDRHAVEMANMRRWAVAETPVLRETKEVMYRYV